MTTSQPSTLDARKRDLLDTLLAREGIAVDGPGVLPRRPLPDRAPLSFAQQRLWFLSRFDPASAAYNVPLAIPFSGALQITALERTLNAVVQRHEVLRTCFELEADEPVQRIETSAKVTLSVIDLSNSLVPRPEVAQRLAAEEAARPFDLASCPLLRACLLRWAQDDHTLLLTLHHIVTDAWSMDVLAREMTALYTAFTTGQNPTLPELSVQYADFAAWQRQRLQGEYLQTQLDYWRERLLGVSALELPTDRPRPPVATNRGSAHRFTIPVSLAEALRNQARDQNVTLFMLMLAVFKVLLHRYSGQDDIAVGSPIAGRVRSELEPLIGFFVNSLVLRTTLAGNPPFQELLHRVRDTALGAFAHQELPFEKLVEELQPERDLSRNPLFQVIFQLLRGAAADQPDATIEAGGISAKFDLSFTLQDQGNVLEGFVEYNADLYDADTIERMCGHYLNLVEAFVATPDARIGDAQMLGPDEQQYLQIEVNATAVPHPTEVLHSLMQRVAVSQPTAIAVQAEEGTLRYDELEAQANRLAQRLCKHGVGPDQIVGIHLERSIDMVVAIIATLKAGGAYLPLDPDYPPQRLSYMLEDSSAAVVISRGGGGLALSTGSAVVLDLDQERLRIAEENDTPPTVAVDPEHLAYVIYTSGSSGRPKGVMVPHRAICNHMHWMVSHFGLAAGDDAVLQKTPIGFDASVWEIFAPLVSGGRLVLARQGGHRDAAYLVHTMAQNAVSVLQLVPSQLGLILEESGLAACDALRLVFSGGEPLTADLCVRFRQRLKAELHNLYGPTEATIDATSWPCRDIVRGNCVPIGKPIDNMQAYVLDNYGNLVPRGVPGVLHLSGAGIARGYLGQPQLTSECFRPDPFSRQVDARLYCTGDRVRRRRDGALEFLGRIDQQVKLRGYRIEPAEVARVLESHPAVRQAVATVRIGADGEQGLGAYVVAAVQPPCPVSELRAHLRPLLPDYMMPTWISMLAEIPRTPHGKIDWQALPEPQIEAAPVPPASGSGASLEQRIALIWAQVLGVGEVGLDSNFFDLGGHSMLMVQVQHRLRRDLDMDVALLDLFRYSSVRLLCAQLAGRELPDKPASDSLINPAAPSTTAQRRPSMQSRPMFRRPPARSPGTR